MEPTLNLLEETIGHFDEGALSVRAYTNDVTYIITKGKSPGEYFVTTEAPGFPKEKVSSLEEYFSEVFGIEARY